jgi:hypothetical protein
MAGRAEKRETAAVKAAARKAAEPTPVRAERDGPRHGDIAPELLDTAIEYYQLAVQIQMHYNEMLIRVRSFGLTAVATLLAVAGGAAAADGDTALASGFLTLFGGVRMQVSGVYAFCALMLCTGLFLLDRFYYYRLFMAAVKNCISFEVDNRFALEAIGVRRNPMTLHFVLNVPKLWSDLFVLAFWLIPMLISAVLLIAAFP